MIAAIAWIVGLWCSLGIAALIKAVSTDELPPGSRSQEREDGARRAEEEAEDRRQRLAEATEWYRFCDAVHTDCLERNPPSPKHRTLQNSRGMWLLEIYDGVRVSEDALWFMKRGVLQEMELPSMAHTWKEIGPAEGFLTKADAQRFLKSYRTVGDLMRQAGVPDGGRGR